MPAESYEEREMRKWREHMNDNFRLNVAQLLTRQSNSNEPMREYRGETTELPQELYEKMVSIYAVPYDVRTEALWSNWRSCGILPEDGKLRRPTFWEAQLRFNMQNYLGVDEFVKCCGAYKSQSYSDREAVRKHREASAWSLAIVESVSEPKVAEIAEPVAPKGWVDNEC